MPDDFEYLEEEIQKRIAEAVEAEDQEHTEDSDSKGMMVAAVIASTAGM